MTLHDKLPKGTQHMTWK